MSTKPGHLYWSLSCPYVLCVCCHQVRGYPTIKVFAKGEQPVDYEGGRTRSDIVTHALALFSANAPPPELLEVHRASMCLCFFGCGCVEV